VLFFFLIPISRQGCMEADAFNYDAAASIQPDGACEAKARPAAPRRRAPACPRVGSDVCD
jgi:hypothetical protein